MLSRWQCRSLAPRYSSHSSVTSSCPVMQTCRATLQGKLRLIRAGAQLCSCSQLPCSHYTGEEQGPTPALHSPRQAPHLLPLPVPSATGGNQCRNSLFSSRFPWITFWGIRKEFHELYFLLLIMMLDPRSSTLRQMESSHPQGWTLSSCQAFGAHCILPTLQTGGQHISGVKILSSQLTTSRFPSRAHSQPSDQTFLYTKTFKQSPRGSSLTSDPKLSGYLQLLETWRRLSATQHSTSMHAHMWVQAAFPLMEDCRNITLPWGAPAKWPDYS